MVKGGYQPDTTAPSSRRADFDLLKRVKHLEETGGGGLPGPPGPPGPPGTVQGIVAGVGVTVDNSNPAYPVINATGGGGTGTDEVWIGAADPIVSHPTIELWYDIDASGGDGGGGGGDGALLAYTHDQTTAADTWMIYHPLSFTPGVTVVDTAGDQVEGDVTYQAPGIIMVRFSAAFSGTAYLS